MVLGVSPMLVSNCVTRYASRAYLLDCVPNVISPAAFHIVSAIILPTREATEALVQEINWLQLSQSAYRVDNDTVPDVHIGGS